MNIPCWLMQGFQLSLFLPILTKYLLMDCFSSSLAFGIQATAHKLSRRSLSLCVTEAAQPYVPPARLAPPEVTQAAWS